MSKRTRPPKRAASAKVPAARPVEAARPAEGREAPPPRRSNANSYLYGIIRWPAPKASIESFGAGVGDPPRPVRVVRLDDVAALVSDVIGAEMSAQGLRGTRRDMKAHAAVVNRVAAATTLLPVRFGVVLPNEQALVDRFLQPQYPRLLKYLEHLDGTVEVTLRANSLEEPTLHAVVEERPDLLPSSGGRRGGGSMAQEARIEQGRRLAAAIHDIQERDAQWILDNLAPVVRDVRIGKPLRDLMALNASFLIERKKLPKFDHRLEQLNAEVGHRIQFDCVGPLAPYSFVELRL